MGVVDSGTNTTLGGLTPAESLITGNLWSPEEFKAFQLRDYLDFRAMARGTGDATSILRLLANKEAHLYGELVLHDGGVRSFNTFGFTCVTRSQDIASFRSGGSEGDEKLRVTKDGHLERPVPTLADVTLHASAFFINRQGSSYTNGGLVMGSSHDSYLAVTAPSGVQEHFFAQFPTRIPQGATITELAITYQRNFNSPVNEIVHAFLYRSSLTTGAGALIDSVAGTDFSGTVQVQTKKLATPEVVDYGAYGYVVKVIVKNEQTANSARFYDLRIKYTYTRIGA